MCIIRLYLSELSNVARDCKIKNWFPCGADGRTVRLVGRADGWSGGRAVGRSVGRCTVTWLPNFLGWIDLHNYGATASLLCDNTCWKKSSHLREWSLVIAGKVKGWQIWRKGYKYVGSNLTRAKQTRRKQRNRATIRTKKYLAFKIIALNRRIE